MSETLKQIETDDKSQQLQLEIDQLRKALAEISKGAGAFSHDPLIHASNCIANMKSIAMVALSKASTK